MESESNATASYGGALILNTYDVLIGIGYIMPILDRVKCAF